MIGTFLSSDLGGSIAACIRPREKLQPRRDWTEAQFRRPSAWRWNPGAAPSPRAASVWQAALFVFARLLLLVVFGNCSYALAQMDAPVRATVKLLPQKDEIPVASPSSSPLQGLRGRFHLARINGITTLSVLDPVVASVRSAMGPVSISIDQDKLPLLSLTASSMKTLLAHLHIPDLHVHQADFQLAIENIEARAVLDEEESAIEIISMRLRPLDLPYWDPPVDVVAHGSVKAETITFRGTTTSAGGRAIVVFDGEAQARGAAGEARFELVPLAFAEGGLQPNQLAPVLGPSLRAVEGTIAANAKIRWSGGEPAISGGLSLRGLSFTTGEVGLEDLSGRITFESIWPPRTPPGQVLTIGRIEQGLKVRNGIIRFQLDDRSRLRIAQADIGFSGGRLSLEPVTLDPTASDHHMVFAAEGLDLQEVLDSVNVEAADASGTVSGRIPVTFSSQGISVNGATLAADTRGILRYQPSAPPEALQQQDDSIELLRNALTNFHYDHFTVTLDGSSGDKWHSTVHIAGNNPRVLEGHPFILNVNVSVVPGEALVQLGAERFRVSDTLPLYNALFGLGFLEWLGDSLSAIDELTSSTDH